MRKSILINKNNKLLTLFFAACFLLFSIGSYAGVTTLIKSNYETYNKAPDIDVREGQDLPTMAKSIIEFIKNQPSGEQLLQRCKKAKIGFFLVHRHMELTPDSIMLEKLEYDPSVSESASPEKALITTTRKMAQLQDSEAISIRSWIVSPQSTPEPFEYSADKGCVNFDNASEWPTIRQLAGYINQMGLASDVGITIIEKAGIACQPNQIFMEKNIIDRANTKQLKVLSIVKPVAASDPSFQTSVVTAVSIDLGQEDGCAPTSWCTPDVYGGHVPGSAHFPEYDLHTLTR